MKNLIKESLRTYVSEMPQISLQGKKVMGGEKPLKELTADEVMENIVIFREDRPNSLFPMGKTWGYFMDSPENAQALARGDIDMITFPFKSMSMRGNPIDDIWKKRKYPIKGGTEHILAVWEGVTTEEEIYIDKLAVRSKYRKASIASKMLDIFRKEYPNAKIVVTGVTDQGRKFVSKYSGTKPDDLHADGSSTDNKFTPDMKLTNPKPASTFKIKP